MPTAMYLSFFSALVTMTKRETIILLSSKSLLKTEKIMINNVSYSMTPACKRVPPDRITLLHRARAAALLMMNSG